jgi:hypothetical protein
LGHPSLFIHKPWQASPLLNAPGSFLSLTFSSSWCFTMFLSSQSLYLNILLTKQNFIMDSCISSNLFSLRVNDNNPYWSSVTTGHNLN